MTTGGRTRPPVWAWPSVLAIDAPVVAVAWAWALARGAGAPFTWAEALAVGFGTAGIYLLDRARDARRVRGDRPPTVRHAVASARPRAYALAAVACLLIAAASVPLLSRAVVAWGVVVGAVAAWLAWLTWRRSTSAHDGHGEDVLRPAWRPLAVGVVFALGAATPVAGRLLSGQAALLPALAGLAAVAALNVASIAAWEARLDDGSPPVAPGLDRRGRTWVGVALALTFVLSQPWWSGVGAALSAGAAGLAAANLGAPRDPSPVAAEAWHLAADGLLLIALLALPLG